MMSTGALHIASFISLNALVAAEPSVKSKLAIGFNISMTGAERIVKSLINFVM